MKRMIVGLVLGVALMAGGVSASVKATHLSPLWRVEAFKPGNHPGVRGRIDYQVLVAADDSASAQAAVDSYYSVPPVDTWQVTKAAGQVLVP